MLVHLQTNHGSTNAHVQCFSTGKMEQMIMMSLESLMLKKGGNYKRRAQLNLGAVVTVVWVSQYKAFGSVNKPQTLYLGCIGDPRRGSISRMNPATCLFICMHPDFAGGL